nr:malate synthase G [Pseudomonas sp.]
VDGPADFQITMDNVDAEVARLAGSQLVVPLLNARFATNAANARWGSLYDALYGPDVIPDEGDLARWGSDYNPARGAKVIAWGRELLDGHFALDTGSHADAIGYRIEVGRLAVELESGSTTGLRDTNGFAGFNGDVASPSSVLLVHHGLHVELQFDASKPVGASDKAGISDIVLESALTTIMDLEDSVAAVDAADKVEGYRNWLELMRGSLSVDVVKDGRVFTRRLHDDREFSNSVGERFTLPGRALLFVRNVGHHMYTDAVLDRDGQPIPEGFVDALLTALGSLPDLRGRSIRPNSRTGSVYVVKPKMHGPEEVVHALELFRRVEGLLGLPERTMKIGLMDEERRMTVNLKAASDRIVFINTGFLDRTGDEIHTSLRAAPFVRRAQLKSRRFIQSYEDRNVAVGLAAGFSGRAQIGKGMWAMPDLLADMLEQKGGHPGAGASTACVPSPIAATLHALHYHEVSVADVQRERAGQAPESLNGVLEIPLAENPEWTPAEIKEELDNNIHSILGYVVRWVAQGVGCSKVPDIRDVALMEDRATLRISSQLLANWLAHDVVSQADVLESMERMARVVDSQNANDPLFDPLTTDGEPGFAFAAARDLILLGAEQPNGYTEPILHAARRAKKAMRVSIS